MCTYSIAGNFGGNCSHLALVEFKFGDLNDQCHRHQIKNLTKISHYTVLQLF